MLKDKFQKKIKSLNYNIESFLFIDYRKGQISAIIKNAKKEKFVVKWKDSSVFDTNASLKREINFYKKVKSNYVINVYYYEKNLIILEYIESKTLRNWIIDYFQINNDDEIRDDFKKVIDNYFNYFVNFYNLSNTFFSKKTVNITISLYGNLMCSGPMCTKSTLLEKYICFLLNRISSFFLKIYLNNTIEFESITGSNIHGDLHLNNILVDKEDLSFKIIDWGDVLIESPLIDLLYSYSMIFILLKSFPKHLTYFKKNSYLVYSKLDPKIRKYYDIINKIFLIGISTNKRFSYNLKTSSLFVNIVKFPFSFFV